MTAYTATLTIATPRGIRYRGVSYLGTSGPRRYVDTGERLPKGADIRYVSPDRIHANEAWELARSRTIHHNLFHDGSAWSQSAEARKLHCGYRCGEP